LKNENLLKVQFRIKNVSGKSEPVSGYAFVVLKTGDMDRSKWLVFPRVALISDKPSRIKKGRYFSIARFKTVRFSVIVEDPYQYKNATVIIFGAEEKYLLEKNIPVDIQVEQTQAASE